MGGPSSEHEVSLNSGINILNALDKSKYNIKIVKIEKNGKWLVSPGFIRELPEKNGSSLVESSINSVKPISGSLAVDMMDNEKIDVGVIAMHGKFGEDGTIQALFDLAGIPYTGSGVLASALAMDKIKSNELYQFHGLKVPKYMAFTKNNLEEKKNELIAFADQWATVLKPSDGGSSKGTYIIKNSRDFLAKVGEAFEFSDSLMLQEQILGAELTCAVLEIDSRPKALPPTQIIPKNGEFFDFEAKYVVGASEEITPAPQPENIIKALQKDALLAHGVLGCRGMSRTDFILRGGELFILETNTIPGMTATSLLPQAAAADNINYTELLDILIQGALDKNSGTEHDRRND